MRVRILAVFLLALVPSVLYVWKNPDMPEFGRMHDDGLLFVSAKSLATGEGFRIASLPEQPAQTKYPVLYPLFLSMVWKLNPQFPNNLLLARLFSWLLMVLALGLCWRYYRAEGFSDPRIMLLIVLLGLNPYMITFGTNTFSEVFFLCWLLGVFLLARSETAWAAILAGAVAGCSYLSRTAGIALLVSMPAVYLWRRQPRRAVQFIAGMLPFIAGWMLWSREHILHTADQTLIYYTDYVKMEFLTVGFDNFHLVLWKNIDGLLSGLGGLAVPQVFGTLPFKIFTQAVAVAMISGTVRLFRRGVAVQYSLFALISSLMLIVWHFPPNERFVLPLCPLMLAGLLAELEHLGSMIKSGFRHKDKQQRVAAYAIATVVASLLLGIITLQGVMSFEFLNEGARQNQAKLQQMRAAYAWIATNVPESARVLSNDDPILYLYSGRRGHVIPLMPRYWYADNHENIVSTYRGIAEYARSHGFEYFYSNVDETSRWTDDPDDIQAIHKAVRENPDLVPLYSSNFGTVYKVR